MAKAANKAPAADPMPRRVEPCVATLVDKPPKGPEWAFEVKWDGYRLAVHVEPGEVRAITRGGYDWAKKFGSIVAEARELGHASLIIDGEAVVLDDQGRSDFGLLQRAVGKKPSLHEPSEIIYYAFDLLYLDGRDLRALPLSERRQLLERTTLFEHRQVVDLVSRPDEFGDEGGGQRHAFRPILRVPVSAAS